MPNLFYYTFVSNEPGMLLFSLKGIKGIQLNNMAHFDRKDLLIG